MNPSPNLFLIGPMGAGKTTVGRRVAEQLGLAFHDLDQEIEARSGADIPLIFELECEAGFRKRESDVLDELSARHGVLLSTGGGAVLRAENRQRLRERGFVVYLETTVEQQLKRLAHDRKRPLLAAPDRRERLSTLLAERELIIDAGPGSSSAGAARRVVAELAQHWQRSPARTDAGRAA